MDTERLATTFVELADSLVDEYDVIELLQLLTERCVQLLGVDAAGLLLRDQHGVLQVAASSSEQVRLVELFQLQNDEGPCLDCYIEGRPVGTDRLSGADQRWPRFAAEATAAGFAAVHAVPLRLRGETIGALNLFWAPPAEVRTHDLSVAQALADVATIAILQERLTRSRELLAGQLQAALNSRVVIEQAKGVLAERGGMDMGTAFDLLRRAARSSNRRLADVAAGVVEGRDSLDGEETWRPG
ncbi:MAG TPA: GAF and ANTAR domain-containing protein [Kribbellaceae bacterium]